MKDFGVIKMDNSELGRKRKPRRKKLVFNVEETKEKLRLFASFCFVTFKSYTICIILSHVVCQKTETLTKQIYLGNASDVFLMNANNLTMHLKLSKQPVRIVKKYINSTCFSQQELMKEYQELNREWVLDWEDTFTR